MARPNEIQAVGGEDKHRPQDRIDIEAFAIEPKAEKGGQRDLRKPIGASSDAGMTMPSTLRHSMTTKAGISRPSSRPAIVMASMAATQPAIHSAACEIDDTDARIPMPKKRD